MPGKDDQSGIYEENNSPNRDTRVGLKSHPRLWKNTAKFPHLIDQGFRFYYSN